MKIELTGISQETSLSNPETSSYFMVFNEELRIPVSMEAVNILVYYLNSAEEVPAEPDNYVEPSESEDGDDDDEEDDGVPSI